MSKFEFNAIQFLFYKMKAALNQTEITQEIKKSQDDQYSKKHWFDLLDEILNQELQSINQRLTDFTIKKIQSISTDDYIYQVEQDEQECIFLSQNLQCCSCDQYHQMLCQGFDNIYVSLIV